MNDMRKKNALESYKEKENIGHNVCEWGSVLAFTKKNNNDSYNEMSIIWRIIEQYNHKTNYWKIFIR